MPKAQRRKATTVEQCATCQHPKRATIDKMLVAGKAVNAVATAFGLSEASVRRHTKHIRAMVTAAHGQRERRRRLSMLSVEDQYEKDGKEIDRLIADTKDPEQKQRWYLVKFKWYDLGLKYAFLSATLRRRSHGGPKAEEQEPLPEAVQRVIDAVVSDG